MSQAAEYSYAYFIDRGYSPQAAAAIVGNFDHESGFNTKAIHDEGTGFGIAGWRDPPNEGGGRRADLMAYAKRNKLNPNSLGTQLQFADYEMQTSEKDVGRRLKKAKTVEEANNVMMDYERPQGWKKGRPQAGHGYSSRLTRARRAFEVYAGSGSADGPIMASYRDDRANPEFVDNTNTEAIPTNEMAWDEESLEKAADSIPAEKTVGSRMKEGIKGLLAGMGQEREQGPFDYTPAGENEGDEDYDPNAGAVPLDYWRQQMNYAEGGNVDNYIDPREWFAMVEGAS